MNQQAFFPKFREQGENAISMKYSNLCPRLVPFALSLALQSHSFIFGFVSFRFQYPETKLEFAHLTFDPRLSYISLPLPRSTRPTLDLLDWVMCPSSKLLWHSEHSSFSAIITLYSSLFQSVFSDYLCQHYFCCLLKQSIPGPHS